MSKHPPMPVMSNIVSHWINGKVVTDTGARAQDVFNPATGQATRKVELATLATVDAAVSSARAAFPAWSPPTQ